MPIVKSEFYACYDCADWRTPATEGPSVRLLELEIRVFVCRGSVVVRVYPIWAGRVEARARAVFVDQTIPLEDILQGGAVAYARARLDDEGAPVVIEPTIDSVDRYKAWTEQGMNVGFDHAVTAAAFLASVVEEDSEFAARLDTAFADTVAIVAPRLKDWGADALALAIGSARKQLGMGGDIFRAAGVLKAKEPA